MNRTHNQQDFKTAVHDTTPVASFRQVSKHYGEVIAAHQLDLDVYAGEFLSLLGASGCGKTTSLRMLAGFEQPTSGTVLLQDQVVNAVPAYKRPVNMVFQHYALFPHLSVAENVAYGLKQRKPRPTRRVINDRVSEILELVRLGTYQKRRVWELSGGQQQRIALARALINKPAILLLDEPLAALDRKLRHEMQIELQTLQRNVGITFVLVTHDQEEALSMSDRVCLMHDGQIMQIGSARELYDQPCNRYVADFVGRANIFSARVSSTGQDHTMVVLSDGTQLTSDNPNNHPGLHPGANVEVVIRPEQLLAYRDKALTPDQQSVRLRGTIINRIFLGEHTEYLLHHDSLGEFLLLTPRQSEAAEPPFETGESVYVSCARNAALILDKHQEASNPARQAD